MKYVNDGYVITAIGGDVEDDTNINFNATTGNYATANSIFTEMCSKYFHQGCKLYHVELSVMLKADTDIDGETGGVLVLKETTFEHEGETNE